MLPSPGPLTPFFVVAGNVGLYEGLALGLRLCSLSRLGRPGLTCCSAQRVTGAPRKRASRLLAELALEPFLRPCHKVQAGKQLRLTLFFDHGRAPKPLDPLTPQQRGREEAALAFLRQVRSIN